MQDTHTDYDVLIIGGGMVGSTLACALKDCSLSIAIIDPNTFSSDTSKQKSQFDLRVSAITRASQKIFEALGVWDKMKVYPFREMRVWQESSNEVHFDSAMLGDPQLGHIVENREILGALHKSMSSQDNLTTLFGRKCQSMEFDEQQQAWILQLVDGESIKCKLVLAADGSRSWTRQQLDISQRGWDYQHEAIVCYVRTQQPHAYTAWQRFLPNGPLAFLPLAENYSSIVWSTRPEHAQQLMAMPDDEFSRELELAYDSRLGPIEELSVRASFPLKFALSKHYIAQQAALLGDAAHSIHPLAGQGVNLGLGDAASLAQLVVAASQSGESFYSKRLLRQYERWRKSENLNMLVGVDSIQRLFASTSPILNWLRGTGMFVVNRLGPIKQQIIGAAMGLNGDLPELSRHSQID